jgi:DMSO/TMAO reductase YedYZ molybdopterin-dependent catalytic subunit
MKVNRREFAGRLAAAGAALAFERWLHAQSLSPLRNGRLVRTMPLGRFDRRPAPPFHALLGTGLDARQFTDLSAVDADHLVTPTERFYIRTSRPPELPDPRAWRVVCGGLVDKEVALDIAGLEAGARDQGAHVMECSGNSDPANFGLLSAANWSGIRLADVFDRVRPMSTARLVRITGLDEERARSVTSTPGASWVFTRDELDRSSAFLALGMNGARLTPDHGAPVRLLVPNYYGCSCIKWVSRIDWVSGEEPATSQMIEFAARTHQDGIPRLARDYQPPVIDLTAMPIRVEQWSVTENGRERIVYRVVGLRWGGAVRQAPMTIRFKSSEPFVPVDDNPPVENPTTWSLWSHSWTPKEPGRYQIAMSVSDRSIRTRRLDIYFYTREVEITDT